MADRQTAGRGRHGRNWISEPGNLYLSILLRPSHWPPDSVSALPLLAGIAVAEAASEWGLEARLKWPNDVVAGERKLAGLLAEASSLGGEVDHVVLGIGVNLLAAPSGESATSVQAETGRAVKPDAAAAAVLFACHRCVGELVPRGSGPIVAAWRERAVDWIGREVEVVSAGVRVTGRFEGIDDTGALVLASERGRMRVVSGEARALRLAGRGAPEEPS